MAMMLASSARARRSAHEEVTIGHCIRQAAGGKPWLEKTLWGLRDQEAGWIGAEVANSNGTHDLGPLQINSWWVGKIAQRLRQPPQNVHQWLRYDACFNAAAARWIFLSGISVTHDYWKAIGVYHSPTEWRQTQYAASVANHLRRRYGLGIFRPPEVPH
ncbi:MAG TPA: lytic transglycosylase domain-containing protein [Sphingobium sp.]|uniref:lytic transglycosylase domain-containing protein n=1 Tax=Sphingobium sp. TaxID=1912891 RepID=UPI002ECFB7C9